MSSVSITNTIKALTYKEVIAAIKAECAKINICTKSGRGGGKAKGVHADGRITSAVKEKEYLDLLEKGLKASHPSIVVTRPKERHWYDVSIENIPINLKITTGGTDNAFNKVAILYTISGVETKKRNMNYNQFFRAVRESNKKLMRDHSTEYHYLVVHKDRQGADSVLLKSILDIHSFKSNPCNDLQINWNNEFKHMDHYTPDGDFREKIKELLKVVQTSVRQAVASMREFAAADLEKDIYRVGGESPAEEVAGQEEPVEEGAPQEVLAIEEKVVEAPPSPPQEVLAIEEKVVEAPPQEVLATEELAPSQAAPTEDVSPPSPQEDNAEDGNKTLESCL